MTTSTSTAGALETLAKYRHLVAVAAAIVFLALVLPAPESDTTVASGQVDATAPSSGATTGVGDESGLGGARSDQTSADMTADPTDTSGSAALGGEPAATPTTSDGGDGTAGPSAPSTTAATPETGDAPMVANCDPETGRVKIPSIYAAPCVRAHQGSNGGATFQGVTEDTIKIVFYLPEVDPAVEGALTAAGASNSRDEIVETFRAYVELFQSHYNTWGREVEIVLYEARGEADDDAAAQADAIDIATDIEPFLVTAPTDGSVSNAFAETIGSRQILCICGVSKPQDFYEGLQPYVGYTTLMSSTQGYVHRAEYVCKRLAGGKAAHAGFRDTPADPMSDEDRKFALLYLDNEARDYTAGADYFMELVGACGVPVTRIEYAFDPATLQEQASAQISRMKSDGITTVVFAGDPIAPAIFTKEATNQRWFPEWIVTGSALTDTNLFGRTYDQRQWEHAFGISYGPALYEPTRSDAYRLHEWHYGTGPAADNVYSTLYVIAFHMFTGLHLAGPELTPHTFQAGIFSYPPTGGGPTAPLVSFGDHDIWPRVDLTSYDDITEIWWDPNAVGPDQVGNEGAGMYHYVDNGRRYLPGQQPTSAPNVFDPENAPTFFETRPESDQPPSYPPPR